MPISASVSAARRFVGKTHAYRLRLLCVVAGGQVLVACGGDSAERAASEPADSNSVVNITWEWVSSMNPTERVTVENPERYTVLLQDDGQARIRFDCNQGGGAFELSPGKLSFGPLMSTRMACPEGSQDAVFMGQLEGVVSYFLREGDLFLELAADGGTMRFRRAGS